ncbi:MAG TPA: hypothetical protein VH518_22945 [Tepidisphaeraceae bacterium]|jgi:hypothetical protein
MGYEYRYSSRSPTSASTPATNGRRPAPRIRPTGNGNGRGVVGAATSRPASLDWPVWLGLIERKRRLIQRVHQGMNSPSPPRQYFVLATLSSFRLEGIDSSDEEVIEAVSRGPSRRKLRSRASQRIRNHIAILHTIESNLRLGQPLKTSAILRWYTSIGSGLSTTGLGAEKMLRLEHIARRINSPQLRLQPAIQEIARTHVELVNDPVFPSFNGILSRLLLRYHLGRCGLPFVIFDSEMPAIELTLDPSLTLRMLHALDQSYDWLLAPQGR